MSSAATSSEDRINFPSSVLILGAGVFGLSTAWALTQDARYANTKITLLERAAEFPAPDGSSIDSSRIVRADYPISAYARLAGQAQERWRGEWGADGRYTESGLAIFSGDDDDQDLKVASREGFDADVAEKARLYAEKTLKNVIEDLGLKVGPRDQGGQATPFAGEAAARKVMGTTGGLVGTKGYVNWTSGWAHAEEGMCYLWQKVLGTGRVDVRTGAQVRRLLFDDTRTDVRGVELESGERITADATILALGAWTPKFVDLRGIASSTGQVLAYVNITPEEEARLAQNPVFICYRTGMFIIPPRNGVLKVARHGYGYANPTSLPHPEEPDAPPMTVSLPRTKRDNADLEVPAEGLAACRAFLADCIPDLATRPWTYSRVCWYTDTKNGDFLVTYHPAYPSLFLATGGSGHGYKFLPILGERVVQVLSRKFSDAQDGENDHDDDLGRELQRMWAWPGRGLHEPDHVYTVDRRGGRRGMILDEELRKDRTKDQQVTQAVVTAAS